MIDTLYIQDTIKGKIPEYYDLISKVDSFYESAWSKLIIFGSIALGILGVVLPVLFELYKWRQYKNDQKAIYDEVKNEIEKIKKLIIDDTDKKIDEKFINIDRQLKLVEQKSKAGIYFMQGRLALDNRNPFQAMPNFMTSIKASMECEDYVNVVSALQIIKVECLPFLSIEALSIVKETYNMDFSSYLSQITNLDKTGMFSYEIAQIRIILNKMPKTQQELKEKLEKAQAQQSNQKKDI